MVAAAGTPSPPAPSLQPLLQELGALLSDGGGHGGSGAGSGSGSSGGPTAPESMAPNAVARLRQVAVLVFTTVALPCAGGDMSNPPTTSEAGVKNLRLVLRLLSFITTRFPSLFTPPHGGDAAIRIARRLLPLIAVPDAGRCGGAAAGDAALALIAGACRHGGDLLGADLLTDLIDLAVAAHDPVGALGPLCQPLVRIARRLGGSNAPGRIVVADVRQARLLIRGACRLVSRLCLDEPHATALLPTRQARRLLGLCRVVERPSLAALLDACVALVVARGGGEGLDDVVLAAVADALDTLASDDGADADGAAADDAAAVDTAANADRAGRISHDVPALLAELVGAAAPTSVIRSRGPLLAAARAAASAAGAAPPDLAASLEPVIAALAASAPWSAAVLAPVLAATGRDSSTFAEAAGLVAASGAMPRRPTLARAAGVDDAATVAHQDKRARTADGPPSASSTSFATAAYGPALTEALRHAWTRWHRDVASISRAGGPVGASQLLTASRLLAVLCLDPDARWTVAAAAPGAWGLLDAALDGGTAAQAGGRRWDAAAGFAVRWLLLIAVAVVQEGSAFQASTDTARAAGIVERLATGWAAHHAAPGGPAHRGLLLATAAALAPGPNARRRAFRALRRAAARGDASALEAALGLARADRFLNAVDSEAGGTPGAELPRMLEPLGDGSRSTSLSALLTRCAALHLAASAPAAGPVGLASAVGDLLAAVRRAGWGADDPSRGGGPGAAEASLLARLANADSPTPLPPPQPPLGAVAAKLVEASLAALDIGGQLHATAVAALAAAARGGPSYIPDANALPGVVLLAIRVAPAQALTREALLDLLSAISTPPRLFDVAFPSPHGGEGERATVEAEGGGATRALVELRAALRSDCEARTADGIIGSLRAVASVAKGCPPGDVALALATNTILEILDIGLAGPVAHIGELAVATRAAALGVLGSVAQSRGVDLAAFLQSCPKSLEWMVENLAGRPSLFLGVSHVFSPPPGPNGLGGPRGDLGVSDWSEAAARRDLAELATPHVLPPLCASGEEMRPSLRCFAEHLSRPVVDPSRRRGRGADWALQSTLASAAPTPERALVTDKLHVCFARHLVAVADGEGGDDVSLLRFLQSVVEPIEHDGAVDAGGRPERASRGGRGAHALAFGSLKLWGEFDLRAPFAEHLRTSAPLLFWEVLWLTSADDSAFARTGTEESLFLSEDLEATYLNRAVAVALLESRLTAFIADGDGDGRSRRGRCRAGRGARGGGAGPNPADAAACAAEAPAATVQAFLRTRGRTMQMLLYASDFCEGRLPQGRNWSPRWGRQRPVTSHEVLRATRLVSLLAVFVGSDIGDAEPQFSAVLKRALDREDVETRCAALVGWAVLVRCLSFHAPSVLASVANRIVVVVLRFLEDVSCPEHLLAARVVELLVMGEGSVLCPDILRSLPPLPRVDALRHVRAVMGNCQASLTTSERAALIVAGLSHEAHGIRLATVTELVRLLREPDFRGAVLASSAATEGVGAVDPATGRDDVPQGLLPGLIEALLRCSDVALRVNVTAGRSSRGDATVSREQRLICVRAAECLGSLGALDPARIVVNLSARLELLTDPLQFKKALVDRHLVRLLRSSSDIPSLVNAMLTIQQLLKGDDDPPTTAEGGGSAGDRQDLFSELDPSVQPVVKPFLSTSFVPASDGGDAPPAMVVISRPGLDFRAWLREWIRQLSTFTSGPWERIFAECGRVLRYDAPLMLFALPHVVFQALSSSGDAAVARVGDEVVAVLRSAGEGGGASVMALQTVFGLLDVLSRYTWWRLLQEGRAATTSGTLLCSASSDPTTPDGLVRQLLDSVAWDLRARAAHQAGAHARALLYLEMHLRTHPSADGGGLNPAARLTPSFPVVDVAFLERIYAQLEDPDGLLGAVALRPDGSRFDPAAGIPLAEQAGTITEAALLYDQALVAETSKPVSERSEVAEAELRRGRSRCLLRAGEGRSVLEGTDALVGSMMGDSALGRELAVVGVAAAWRLGCWDELDEWLEAAGASLTTLSLGSRLRPQSPAEPSTVLASLTPGGVLSGHRRAANDDDLWELRVGQLVSADRRGDAPAVAKILEDARLEVMEPLSAASMESYARAYPHLLKLHVLQELEDASLWLRGREGAGSLVSASLADDASCEEALRWAERLRLTDASPATREPILVARRLIASRAGLPQLVGSLCLEQARLGRESGHLEAGKWCLESLRLGAPGSDVELARLQWASGQQDRAMRILRDHLTAAAAPGSDAGNGAISSRGNNPHARAEAAVLLATWTAETGQGGREEVEPLFAAAVELAPRWWRPFFDYARYLDMILEDAKARQLGGTGVDAGGAGGTVAPAPGLRFGSRARIQVHHERPWAEQVPNVARNYLEAVRHGTEAVYQALPRLLTVVFHLGAQAHSAEESGGGTSTSRRAMREAVRVTLDVVTAEARGLPTYLWLSVMPQLVSRILHPHQPTFDLIQRLIVGATARYPQQALYALASSRTSTSAPRRRRAEDILAAAQAKAVITDPILASYFIDFVRVQTQLLAVCHKAAPKTAKRLSFRDDFPPEVKAAFPALCVLPTRHALGLQLPPGGSPPPDASHRAFAPPVVIAGVRDGIDLLQSLMRPKKLVLVGSDGVDYPFLAKPKDDLRKDTRMMEMGSVLNRVFAGRIENRRRGMKVRTFAVTPLTEDSGLVEWVPRTTGFRQCCQEVYVLDGKYDRRTTNGEIRRLHEAATREGVSPDVLLDSILERFPPRLHRWFAARFPEPAAWLRARSNFTVTMAVWAMVGHVMGLGDRHGENILVDSSCGDVVMIDFSCLFDKGLTLEKPELVPFRLTQNVIDAMGVTGVEGTYRKACEQTLAALRLHQDTIASLAETFVHDPLVDWSWKGGRGRGGAREAEVGGIDNPAALDALKQIEGRIAGTLVGVSSAPSTALSVEGHAQRLIMEACSKRNLGSMYIWWMASRGAKKGGRVTTSLRIAGPWRLRCTAVPPSTLPQPFLDVNPPLRHPPLHTPPPPAMALVPPGRTGTTTPPV